MPPTFSSSRAARDGREPLQPHCRTLAGRPETDRWLGDRGLGRRLAAAAADFEQRLFGRPPRQVTVTTGRDLVVCLQQPLAEIEREVAAEPAGWERLCCVHHELFAASQLAFREHVAEATGVDLATAVLGIDREIGCLLKAFSTGPTIDLYQFGPPTPPSDPLERQVEAAAETRQPARSSDRGSGDCHCPQGGGGQRSSPRLPAVMKDRQPRRGDPCWY